MCFPVPLPDSALKVRLCSFFYHHFGSVHRSRMTAEDTGIKYILRYPMPDSSLRVILCSFLLSSFRFLPPLKNDGRGVAFKYLLVIYSMPDSSLRVILCSFLPSSFRFLPPLKNDGTRGLRFLMVLNTGLSFLNEVKNPGREYRC